MTFDRSLKRAVHKRDVAGSPEGGEPVFLAVGKILRPHGVRGEVSMYVLTDFPERLKKGAQVYLGEAHRPRTILSTRPHKKNLLIAFEGIADRDRAALLSKQLVFVRVDEIPSLPEGEFYHHQMIGLRAVTEEGRALGTVVEIITTGANDVYVIRPAGEPEARQRRSRDVLIPATDEVIVKVDLETETLVVHLLPGLLPEKPA